MQPKVDYIIVGQGIAGSVLAVSLHLKGFSTLFFDLGEPHTSSKTAAGLWNPITFRKLKKGWNADALIQHLETFYPKAEALLNTNFYHPKPVVKRFSDYEEWNDWDVKSQPDQLGKYLGKQTFPKVDAHIALKMPEGYGEVKHTGYVHVAEMLGSVKEFWLNEGLYCTERFVEERMEWKEDGVCYNGIEAKAVVYCQGEGARENVFTENLKVNATKGQVLLVDAPELDLDVVVNAGIFILPLGGSLYKVGATFEWDVPHTLPTEEGLNEIEEKLKKVYRGGYTVLGHYAANRPTTPDRRPLVGKVPEKQAYVLNGLGTKGILNAPYSADVLIQNMLHQQPIPKELDLYRFKK